MSSDPEVLLSGTTDFTVTEQHLQLLRRAWVVWYDGETGAPAIDCKRPYGNSNVAFDVAEIIGETLPEDEDLSDADYERLLQLHYETVVVLQIALVTGEFKPGRYTKTSRYGNDWRPAE